MIVCEQCGKVIYVGYNPANDEEVFYSEECADEYFNSEEEEDD